MNNPIDKWMGDFDMVIRTDAYEALQDLFASSRCLHQIQEPAAWHAVLDEGRAQAAPSAVAMSDVGIALLMNRSACQKYPNDINLRIAHNEGWKAARAALAATTAADSKLQMLVLESISELELVPITVANGIDPRVKAIQSAKNMRAKLNEIQTKAVPVELPEPVATLHCNGKSYVWALASESGKRMRSEQPIALYTEQQVRALLATATGLPAQATEEMVRAVAFELIGITPETPLAEASVKPYLKQAKKLLEVAFNAAPHAHADARDARKSGCAESNRYCHARMCLDGDAEHEHDCPAGRAAIAAAKGEQQ